MFGYSGPTATPAKLGPPGAPAAVVPIAPAPVVAAATPPGALAPPPPGQQAKPLVGGHKQTVLGMAMAPPVAAPPLAPAAPPPVDPGVLDKKRTMLGVAIPGIAPLSASAPAAEPRSNRGPSSTMLGVAMPGIAPVRATEGAPAYRPPPASAPRPAPVVLPRPAPLVDDEPAVGPVPRLDRRGVPLAFVAGAVLALVLGFGAAVAFLWKGQSLLVTPRLDDKGNDQLHLVCEGCPDDTTAQLGKVKATFQGKQADLTLPTPLQVGDNSLSIWLDRPRLGRDEEVKVVVPIAFRIKADLSSLTGAQPAVIVQVQAVKGTVVRVDDKPVTLDSTGKGTYSLDVSAQTNGWSDDVRLIDQAIPYTIVSSADPTHLPSEQRGSLAVRAGIASLHLDAPGPSPVIETGTFRIAGRTVKGGTVTVNGQPVSMDPDGSFTRSYDAAAVGDIPVEVRADGPQLASRTAHFTVKRVAHLSDEAKARERSPWVGFDAMASAGNVGKAAIVEGDVVEARSASSQVVALVDDTRGCARAAGVACLVRVVYGGDEPLAHGDHVRVYGRVTSAPKPTDARPVPEVAADFVVKGRAGHR
jgi:hypothetical protein